MLTYLKSALNFKSINVQALAGGSEGIQLGPFQHALQNIERHLFETRGIDLKIAFKFNEELKKDGWTPYDLLKWLQSSQVYFILTHAHQAMSHWNATHVHQLLASLSENT